MSLREPRRASRPQPPAWFVLAALGFMVFVGCGMLASYLSEHFARQALFGAVAKSTGARLNGEPVEDPSVLLRALRSMHFVPAHHSSPRAPIRIELVDHGREVARIVIARDSHRPSEIWVFRPGSNWHGTPLGQEAGRIMTAELDEYLRRRGL